MAKLYFRHGTVGSGKSLNLLAVAHNYKQQGKKICLVKPAVDTRFGVSEIRSRSGFEEQCDLCVHEKSVLEYDNFRGVDCVLVDECQFLSEFVINQLRNISVDLDIPVICYGLRTNFKSGLFAGSKRLMEIADSIEEVKTTCAFCNRKAVFNLKSVNGKAVCEGAEVELGCEESYLPACCKCYEKRLGRKSPLRVVDNQHFSAVRHDEKIPLPVGKKHFWFVRHGQTLFNAEEILSGWTDVELSDLGREQAKKLRASLQDVYFDAAYSSDLRRAIETATLAYGEPIIDARIREINFGEYDGIKIAELDPAWVKALYSFSVLNTPGGESFEDVRRRVVDFLSSLPDGRFLIVCHGGVIRGISRLMGEDRFLNNGEILKIDWSQQKILRD